MYFLEIQTTGRLGCYHPTTTHPNFGIQYHQGPEDLAYSTEYRHIEEFVSVAGCQDCAADGPTNECSVGNFLRPSSIF